MKRLVLSVAALLFVVISGSAQGWYFTGGLGYAFQHGGGTTDIFGNPYSGSINYSNNGATYLNYSMDKASFSTGLMGKIAFGYMATEHIGFELGATLALAPTKYTLNTTNENLTGNYFVNSAKVQSASSFMLLTPSVILQENYKKFNFYTKFGIAIPVGVSILYQQTDNAIDSGYYTGLPNEIDYYAYNYKTSFSVGFCGTIGAAYRIADNFSIYGECSLLSMTMYLSEIDNTDFQVNGQSGTTDSSYKFGFNGNNVTPSASRTGLMSRDIPFSNVSINFGIHYLFSKSDGRRTTSHTRYDEDKPRRF
jgi:hypothetical protein